MCIAYEVTDIITQIIAAQLGYISLHVNELLVFDINRFNITILIIYID